MHTDFPCMHICVMSTHMHARTLTRPGELLLGRGRIVVVLDQLVLAEEAVGSQGARPPCHGLSIILQSHRPGLWVPMGKGHAWGRSMALGRSWALGWLVVAPQNGCVGRVIRHFPLAGVGRPGGRGEGCPGQTEVA